MYGMDLVGCFLSLRSSAHRIECAQRRPQEGMVRACGSAASAARGSMASDCGSVCRCVWPPSRCSASRLVLAYYAWTGCQLARLPRSRMQPGPQGAGAARGGRRARGQCTYSYGSAAPPADPFLASSRPQIRSSRPPADMPAEWRLMSANAARRARTDGRLHDSNDWTIMQQCTLR